MEDNNSVHDEALRICCDYKLRTKLYGQRLSDYWLISDGSLDLMPENFQSKTICYGNIRAIFLLESEGVLTMIQLSADGRFPVEDYNQTPKDIYPTSENNYTGRYYEKQETVKGKPFPPGLLRIFFFDELVDKFINKTPVIYSQGGWINKKNGEYQFSNGKVHTEKANIKKRVFIEMMDLCLNKSVVSPSVLATKTGLPVKRIRTEINQISNKMKTSVGYRFSSEGKGYYELKELTN